VFGIAIATLIYKVGDARQRRILRGLKGQGVQTRKCLEQLRRNYPGHSEAWYWRKATQLVIKQKAVGNANQLLTWHRKTVHYNRKD
jgi:hypothetical protein